MMNDELLRALRPVKTRIRRNRFLRGAAAGLAASLAAAVILQAAAFFTPVPDRGLWAAEAAAAAALLAALGSAARPVKNKTAAEAADACGLKERVITALEYTDGTPILELQRKDAREALEKLDVKQIRPGSVRKYLFASLGCAVLLAGLLLVPNPQDSEAAARKALARTLQEGRETIERAAEEDAERLPDEKKSGLRKITADLNRELGESRDAADALVALDRAEQRLEQFRNQTAGDAENMSAGTAGETGEGKAGQAGADGDASGDSSPASEGKGTAAAADGAAAAQMKTLQALAALKGAVNPSLQGAGTRTGSGNRETQTGQGGAGMSGNRSGQNGQGASAGGGNNADGPAGGGAGEGTTNEEQQGGGSSSGMIVKGDRDPRYKEVAYETIYDPEHISKSRQDVMTDQFRMGDEDSLQVETGPGRGNTNGDVPWSEALQEYADTEARAADRENLTIREKQWVNEYYRLLTEQQ